jgi:hypothetical protein
MDPRDAESFFETKMVLHRKHETGVCIPPIFIWLLVVIVLALQISLRVDVRFEVEAPECQ